MKAVQKHEKADGYIGRHPEKPEGYDGKARAFAKQYEETSDRKCLIQAVSYFNIAIAKSGNSNTVYLANRSKIYRDLGEIDLAIRDVETICRIKKEKESRGEKIEGLDGIYITTTLRDIGQLKEIKDGIAELVEKGRVDEDLAKFINSHVEVTGRLVVRVGGHDELLATIVEIMQTLQRGGKIQQEQMDRLSAQSQKHEADINDSFTHIEAENNRKIKALEEENNPELLDYYRTFYWTAQHTLDAYGTLSTGKFKGNTDPHASMAQKAVAAAGAHADSIMKGAVEAGKVVGIMSVEAAKILPIVGTVVSLITKGASALYEARKQNAFDDEVNKITSVMDSKFYSASKIELCMQSMALELVESRRGDILNHQDPVLGDSNPGALSKAKNWLEAKFKGTKEAVLGKVEKLNDPDSHATKLALSDITFLLAHIVMHYKEIKDDNTPIIDQLLSIVKSGRILTKLQEQLGQLPLPESEQDESAPGVEIANESAAAHSLPAEADVSYSHAQHKEVEKIGVIIDNNGDGALN